MKKLMIGGVAILIATVVAVAMEQTKCRYCGSTAYGNSCPNGVHVHNDTDERCEYCGYPYYGKSCSFAPRGVHRHGHGDGKCVWCGYKQSGKSCSFSPNGYHEQ